MMLDDRGVHALGKVSDERKLAELARADVLCAPSLRGESFGMILTEAFAAATPVLASDIPGYRDVVRDGIDGQLVAPGDPLALAEALRRLALDRPRASAWRAPRASAPSASPGRTSRRKCSTPTSRRSRSPSQPRRRSARRARARGAALRLRARRSAAARARSAAALAARPAAAAGRARAARPHAAPRRPGRAVAGRRRPGGAGAAARRRHARGRLAAGLQAGSARRRPGADVRGDVHARDRLARDPRGRADLASRETPRRDAGHVHRRADVLDAARPASASPRAR